jgi:hypothetical protein
MSSIPCDQHCHYLSTSLHLLDPVFIVEQICISNLPPNCDVKFFLHLYVRKVVAKHKVHLLTRSVVYMLLCLISVLAVLLVSGVVLCHLVQLCMPRKVCGSHHQQCCLHVTSGCKESLLVP